MENLFRNNRFYPQNFFICKRRDTDIDAVVKEIANKAYIVSSESFNSETKYFIFKLEYQQPYVKVHEFREIKNLQVEAISKTRFKDEYNGYIGIDISDWIGHTDEEHFVNCIHVLRQMSPNWKYVFFADDNLNKAGIRKAVDYIKSEIWLQELSPDAFARHEFTEMLTQAMMEVYDIKLSLSAQKIITDIFRESDCTHNDELPNITNDISQYFSNKKFISDSDLIGYLSDDTYTRFVMEKAEIARLNDLIAKTEGKR